MEKGALICSANSIDHFKYTIICILNHDTLLQIFIVSHIFESSHSSLGHVHVKQNERKVRLRIEPKKVVAFIIMSCRADKGIGIYLLDNHHQTTVNPMKIYNIFVLFLFNQSLTP